MHIAASAVLGFLLAYAFGWPVIAAEIVLLALILAFFWFAGRRA